MRWEGDRTQDGRVTGDKMGGSWGTFMSSTPSGAALGAH